MSICFQNIPHTKRKSLILPSTCGATIVIMGSLAIPQKVHKFLWHTCCFWSCFTLSITDSKIKLVLTNFTLDKNSTKAKRCWWVFWYWCWLPRPFGTANGTRHWCCAELWLVDIQLVTRNLHIFRSNRPDGSVRCAFTTAHYREIDATQLLNNASISSPHAGKHKVSGQNCWRLSKVFLECHLKRDCPTILLAAPVNFRRCSFPFIV